MGVQQVSGHVIYVSIKWSVISRISSYSYFIGGGVGEEEEGIGSEGFINVVIRIKGGINPADGTRRIVSQSQAISMFGYILSTNPSIRIFFTRFFLQYKTRTNYIPKGQPDND